MRDRHSFRNTLETVMDKVHKSETCWYWLGALETNKAAIARQLGVSRGTIRDVVTGRTWKHIQLVG